MKGREVEEGVEFVVDGDWVCRDVGQCTGGACGLGYGHEPGCGLEGVGRAASVADAKNFVSLLNEHAQRAEKAEAQAQAVRDRSPNSAYRLAAEKLYKALVIAVAEVETLRSENAALRWQVRQDHCPFCFGSCACDGEGN